MTEGVDVPEGNSRRLNRMVAVTVVVLSVAMAVGNIKDGNICQTMQADQASKIDLWNEYQATRIKARDQANAAVILGQFTTPSAAAAVAKANAEAMRHDAESASLKQQAIAAQDDYDIQGRRDDQFDLAEGFMSICLALAGISALIESFGLLCLSWGAGAFGLLFLVAGFESLPIHPDRLVAFLT